MAASVPRMKGRIPAGTVRWVRGSRVPDWLRPARGVGRRVRRLAGSAGAWLPDVVAEPWRVVVGALGVLVPGLVFAAFGSATSPVAPSLILLVAIAFSTYLADWPGGVTAWTLAALIGDLCFVGDPWRFDAPRTADEAFGLATLLGGGIALAWLVERLKRESADDRLAAAAARAAADALAVLETVAARPATDGSGGRIADALVTAMVRFNRAHVGALYLVDGNGRLCRSAEYGAGDAALALPAAIGAADGLTGVVAAGRHPVGVRDILSDPRFEGDPWRLTGARAILGVPLMADDRLLGVAVVGLLVPHRFSRTDTAKLEAVAGRGAALLAAAEQAGRREALLGTARAEQRRLGAIIGAMPEAVVIGEPPDGRIVAVNRAAEALLGTPHEAPGGDVWAVLRLPDGSPILASDTPLGRALGTGGVASGTELLVRREGRPDVPVLASAAPLTRADGAVAAVVAVFQNIAPLKEAERLKDEFVSVVSHELRSPLTPIRGFVQLVARELEREGGHAVHVTRLRSLETQVDRVTRLIDDLLDVSRLRAGRLDIRPEPTDLMAVCRDLVAIRATAAPDHRITYSASGPPVVGVWDPDRLTQVVDNLIGNAIKYGPTGGQVTVSLAVDEGANEAVLDVSDDGPGIPVADQPHVFSAFYRTKDAAESRVAGLGLGLFICHELVTAHGGTIAARTAPSGGASFVVRLPLSPADRTIAQEVRETMTAA